MAPLRVLVIDAEQPTAKRLQATLEARWPQTATRSVAHGGAGRELAVSGQFDLIFLDVQLPDCDCLGLCRAIRRASDVPIVFLASRGQPASPAQALECGADDFLEKPWEEQELLARVQAVLRRAGRSGVPRAPRIAGGGHGESSLVYGALQVDLARHEVRVDGLPVRLTSTEYRLLSSFLDHPGQVLTPRALLARVWGEDHGRTSEHLKIHIQRLRRKLGDCSRRPRIIATERGVGYRLIRDVVKDDSRPSL